MARRRYRPSRAYVWVRPERAGEMAGDVIPGDMVDQSAHHKRWLRYWVRHGIIKHFVEPEPDTDTDDGGESPSNNEDNGNEDQQDQSPPDDGDPGDGDIDDGASAE